MISESEAPPQLHKNEGLKRNSNYLRGTILEGLADVSTGAISADDQQLTKFHGLYLQDNRDVRAGRRKKKLEKAFGFLARVGLPGGVCTPAQWIVMDDLADLCNFKTLKLTTRQAFQLHGILKSNLKYTVQEINKALMSTLAACGDVNRNTLCTPNPEHSEVYPEVQAITEAMDRHLKPKTPAYAEIFLDGEPVETIEGEAVEPIYGVTYLPRKFKIVVAIPPHNDVDIYAHCLGFIAIINDGQLEGFNITVGGGMGMTHGNEKTYPRLADVIAFCKPEQAVAVAEKIVTIQRDFGDRVDRAHARFKYTVEDKGPDFIRAELERRLGVELEDPKPFEFTDNGDRFGWSKNASGTWNLGLYIKGGRIADTAGAPLKTGMRRLSEWLQGEYRLTPNQNLMIANVAESDKNKVDEHVAEYGLDLYRTSSAMMRAHIACVALPTCGLALAESERYLPTLIESLETTLEEVGLAQDEIHIRSTGCPNGCGRPYLGEIGLVGKVPGKWNVYLGAGFAGERLNKLYRKSQTHDEIIDLLKPILIRYAKERNAGERFGDFVIRSGYVKATGPESPFHADVEA